MRIIRWLRLLQACLRRPPVPLPTTPPHNGYRVLSRTQARLYELVLQHRKFSYFRLIPLPRNEAKYDNGWSATADFYVRQYHNHAGLDQLLRAEQDHFHAFDLYLLNGKWEVIGWHGDECYALTRGLDFDPNPEQPEGVSEELVKVIKAELNSWPKVRTYVIRHKWPAFGFGLILAFLGGLLWHDFGDGAVSNAGRLVLGAFFITAGAAWIWARTPRREHSRFRKEVEKLSRKLHAERPFELKKPGWTSPSDYGLKAIERALQEEIKRGHPYDLDEAAGKVVAVEATTAPDLPEPAADDGGNKNVVPFPTADAPQGAEAAEPPHAA